MIIISILVLLLGIYLGSKTRQEFLAVLFIFLGGIFTIVFIILLCTQSYRHNLLLIERDTLQITLNTARIEGRNLENAAITSRVAKFNYQLNKKKYQNTLFLFDHAIDDRIDQIQPVE